MRSLLLTSALLVIAAASAPSLLQGRIDRTLGTAEATGQTRPASSQQRQSRFREVEVKAQTDGHFYVEAEINFRAVRLMVDTGASVIALRQSDAEAAGIRVRPAEFDQPITTANGTAYAAAAELDQVSIQDIEVSNVPAVILPDEQLAISLLGGSFLNRLARFQVAEGTLLLEN